MVASGQVDRYHGSAMTAKRTRKPAHTNAERAALAARLQATYRKGTPVTAWVRRNHAELTHLTREPEFWSWRRESQGLFFKPRSKKPPFRQVDRILNDPRRVEESEKLALQSQ